MFAAVMVTFLIGKIGRRGQASGTTEARRDRSGELVAQKTVAKRKSRDTQVVPQRGFKRLAPNSIAGVGTPHRRSGRTAPNSRDGDSDRRR